MKEVLGTPRSCDVPGDHITDATGSRVDREVISAYLGDSYIYTKGKAGNRKGRRARCPGSKADKCEAAERKSLC